VHFIGEPLPTKIFHCDYVSGLSFKQTIRPFTILVLDFCHRKYGCCLCWWFVLTEFASWRYSAAAQHAMASSLLTDGRLTDTQVPCIFVRIKCPLPLPLPWWLGGVVVSIVVRDPRSRGFDARPPHSRHCICGLAAYAYFPRKAWWFEQLTTVISAT